MYVKYLFDYIEECNSKNVVASWLGLKNYYENMKGRY